MQRRAVESSVAALIRVQRAAGVIGSSIAVQNHIAVLEATATIVNMLLFDQRVMFLRQGTLVSICTLAVARATPSPLRNRWA